MPQKNEIMAEDGSRKRPRTIDPATIAKLKQKIHADQLRLRHEAQKQPPVEDEIDMFALTEEQEEKLVEEAKKAIPASTVVTYAAQAAQLGDMCDDAEGYYIATTGDTLDEGRYIVINESVGRGVFSSVMKCKDIKENKEVAIKVIRKNDMMRQVGEKEARLLNRLNEGDGKQTIINLLRQFNHRGHLCLVFELMSGSLRQVLLRYHRVSGGVPPHLVQQCARQLMLGLRHLKKHRLVHADLKPDNVLVCPEFKQIKICDLGSACEASECSPTTYMVSRYYRAPEIIVGMKFSYPVDIWAAACTIFELVTGKVLFNGTCNADMLKFIIDLKGKLPAKFKNATCWRKYFNSEGSLYHETVDPVTRQTARKVISSLRARTTLHQRYCECSGKNEDIGSSLLDFLDRCLTLDPHKRMTPEDALRHPYLLRPITPA